MHVAPVLARRHAPEVRQPEEHALDCVAVAIEEGRETVLPPAIGFGRNVWHGVSRLDLSADGVAVVTLVAMQNVAARELRQKLCACRAIRDLAAGEHEDDRSALGVRQRMDFGRASAPRAADRLCAFPLYHRLQSDAP
jgi:hypothetical protein